MPAYDTFSSGYDLGMYPVETLILRRLRRRLHPFVVGRTLELGVGTGINLPSYAPDVQLTAIDASLSMLSLAARRHRNAPVDLLQADAQWLPFAEDVFDHAIGSLVFCSIPEPALALGEIRRVLKPGGWLVLLEHVRGEKGAIRLLTDWLAEPWLRLSKSCHLNRDTSLAISEAGFEIVCSSRHAFGIVQVILARAPA